jgi:SOS-response transcriptional repressor LexA
MSEQTQVAEFECFLLRYVPNVVTGEFVNIGLVMWESGAEAENLVDIRFRQDWSRVLQFDPDADVETLAAVCTELSLLLQQAPDRAVVRRKLESSLSNVIQLSDCWAIRAEDPAREIGALAAMYLGCGQSGPQRTTPRLFEQIPAYPARMSRSLPLWGTVAAGRPIEAVQVPETLSLDDVIGSKKVFALKVRGDSMQDEHIIDGDFVLLEKTKKANNGDIVVALVDGYDATLKRFYLQGKIVRLQPSNVTMPPIVVDAASVEIQGKVVGVLRKY